MRGPVIALVVGALTLSVFAGCLGDEPPEPSALTFEAGESTARQAAAADGEDPALVAAFGVAAPRPEALPDISANHSGLAAMAGLITRTPQSVGNGVLQAWAYLYETRPGAETLQAIVVTDTALEETPGFESEGGAWVLQQGVARGELGLLRVNGTVGQAPQVGSDEAYQAALAVQDWSNQTTSSDPFVLFMLTADADDRPFWRLVAGDQTALIGHRVRVDATTGSVAGHTTWPEGVLNDLQIDHTATRMPGDEHRFLIDVPPDYRSFHVVAERTATGEFIGDPRVELVSPEGDATSLTLREWHQTEDPAPGEWNVVYTWDRPDLIRSIVVKHCLEPAPSLFSPGSTCDTNG